MLPSSPGRRRSAVPFGVGLLGAAFVALAACTPADRAVGPAMVPRPAAAALSAGSVVVSQVYGGGGNAGATFTNDFIELYNAGASAVSVSGWSVQYASAAGTSWQVTALSGTIAPGQYYLVQEAAGAGGTTPLPTPDATGTIAMGGSAGKVALVSSTTALTGTGCPIGAPVVDYVGYGTANCFEGTAAAPGLSNPTADLRNNNGAQDTNDNAADFATGAPTPRNGGAPAGGPVTTVAVTPSPATVNVGATVQLTASGTDAQGNRSPSTYTWTTSDASVATVNATGLVTGVAASPTPVTVTATSANNVAGTASVTVTTPPPPGAIASFNAATNISTVPVGFQAQIFTPVARDATHAAVPASFTFTALDPAVATVRAVGNSAIITGVAASSTSPRFQVTATPLGGGDAFSTVVTPLAVEAAVYADSAATFADNAEFGRPSAASASDLNALLIARTTYTASYNASRGTPNWVSYELDRRQITSGQDRCNCFTADPLLPADRQIFTSDYTNGGYDRGHMARSGDRTVTNGENARTFYLTNVVPQTSDLNQGVWVAFENQLSDSAANGRAVYVVTGPLYSGPARYIKQDSGQTKIRIPDSTWKVAFIGPYGAGNPFRRGTIRTWDDLANTTVLAVNMPNVFGVRNDTPSKYFTTVDAIEASTGYDFLSLLQAPYQTAVEAGDHPPAVVLSGPASGAEGAALAFNAAGTSDPDAGDVLAYRFDFGDGTSAAGASAAKTYADDGTYTVTLTVTDRYGWARTRTQQVVVSNAAPEVALAGAATAAAGKTFAVQARFRDAGAKDAPWRLRVDWGDGTAAFTTTSYVQTWTTPLSRGHVYAAPGAYTVTLSVTDKNGTTSTASQAVTVR